MLLPVLIPLVIDQFAQLLSAISSRSICDSIQPLHLDSKISVALASCCIVIRGASSGQL